MNVWVEIGQKTVGKWKDFDMNLRIINEPRVCDLRVIAFTHVSLQADKLT